jgi:predicted RNase H-like HicB family nuclease
MRQFSVLVRRDEELPDQWVAHCLSWDLVSQGDSPAHALKMVCEAIGLVIEEDRQDGRDPSDRPAAPSDMWHLFARVQETGTRISSADVDRFALDLGRPVLFAVIVYWHDKRDDLPASVPPPFMIAEFQSGDQHAQS